MVLAAILFIASRVEEAPCSLMRPVAPDATAARRIAEAIIKNVPASARARAAQAAGESYELIVEADPDNPNQWMAFEHPRDKQGAAGETIVSVAGHGLGFRVNRCSGEISGMHYQR
ncbi:MAG: hypothetical protein V4502_10285 [Pseudomonadota bacterium]